MRNIGAIIQGFSHNAPLEDCLMDKELTDRAELIQERVLQLRDSL
jgi:hypothetical protein